MRFNVKLATVAMLAIASMLLAVPPSTSALELTVSPSARTKQVSNIALKNPLIVSSDDSFVAVEPSVESIVKQVESKNEKATQKAKPAKKATPRTVVVKAGDSLQSIAEKYKTTWIRIFNANPSVSDPDTINPGEKLVVPTASEKLADRYSQYQAAVVAQQSTATTTYTTRSYSTAPVNSTSYYVGNGMWCTDYVHSRRPDVAVYGNAGYNWISSAQAAGKSTGSTPHVGAVAVTNGHVAYVESVNPDGSYVVSEMGWNYTAGQYNKRTVSAGTFGAFIY